MKKYLKHSQIPERDREDSKLTQAVFGALLDSNLPPMKDTLKYGLGSMHYERMNRAQQDSYKTK